ncbi:MAG: hypothetical protein JST62_12325 [Bacteroidetes bacterium]|nr:hypothetical protein [Bacteroidota bacterium]
MKPLQLTTIISFLLICVLDEMGLPLFIIPLMYLYQSITDLFSLNFSSFFEYGIVSLALIGTIIVFFKCKKYTDRFLLLFCVITLFIAAIVLTGSYNTISFHRMNVWYYIPFSVFVLSSIAVVVKAFKKPSNL